MKKLKGAILSQNHWRSQGVAKGTRAPSIKMPPICQSKCQKFVKKALFLHFQVVLASLRSTGPAYNCN